MSEASHVLDALRRAATRHDAQRDPLLVAREKTHGCFRTQSAIVQDIKSVLARGRNAQDLRGEPCIAGDVVPGVRMHRVAFDDSPELGAYVVERLAMALIEICAARNEKREERHCIAHPPQPMR